MCRIIKQSLVNSNRQNVLVLLAVFVRLVETIVDAKFLAESLAVMIKI